mgnify:CR=1 FL=1
MAANCKTMARGNCGTTPAASGGAIGAGGRLVRLAGCLVEIMRIGNWWVGDWWNRDRGRLSVIANGLSPSVRRLSPSAKTCHHLPRPATSSGLRGPESEQGAKPLRTSRRIEVDDLSAVAVLFRRAANFHPIKPD